MYGIRNFDSVKIQEKFQLLSRRLQENYDSLPDTQGCLDHICGGSECGAWCCKEQSPSVWFVEFLNTLIGHVFKMSSGQFVGLIESCLNKYLQIDKGGGCVFWDKDSKLCSHHETRPINCYFYGVTPPSEFNPRYSRLKVLDSSIKPQCDLINLKDGGEYMDRKIIEMSFDVIRKLEIELGVPEDNLHDSTLGSYRSYPEHVLIWMLGEDQMCDLSTVRASHSILDKKKIISSICDNLMEAFTNEQQEQSTSS